MSEKVEILTEDQAVKGLDYPIEVKVYEGGTQKVPSSATITVKDPSGTKQVEDQAMSVDENGTMTYTLSSSKTTKLWENAVIEISYVISTETFNSRSSKPPLGGWRMRCPITGHSSIQSTSSPRI